MDEAVLVPQCKVSLTNILLQNEKVRRRSCFSGDFGRLEGFFVVYFEVYLIKSSKL